MEEIKALLGAALYEEVLKKAKDVRLIIDDGKLIPKHRFDCINFSLKQYKDEVTNLRQEIVRLNDIVAKYFENYEAFQKLKKENCALTEMVGQLLPYKLEFLSEAKI